MYREVATQTACLCLWGEKNNGPHTTRTLQFCRAVNLSLKHLGVADSTVAVEIAPRRHFDEKVKDVLHHSKQFFDMSVSSRFGFLTLPMQHE